MALAASCTLAALVVVWLVVAAPTTAAAAGGGGKWDHLGPGSGAWQRGEPSAHGLDAGELQRAAERIRVAVPHRWCFVVVKDGRRPRVHL